MRVDIDGGMILWTLHKGGHVARAEVGRHPLGPELRYLLDGELRWSRVFRDGDDPLLKEAEAKRAELQSKGWAS